MLPGGTLSNQSTILNIIDLLIHEEVQQGHTSQLHRKGKDQPKQSQLSDMYEQKRCHLHDQNELTNKLSILQRIMDFQNQAYGQSFLPNQDDDLVRLALILCTYAYK